MKIKLAKKEIIHFIGIGGIGMSGLALIMKGHAKVQGSDIIIIKILNDQKTKIKIYLDQSKKILNATIAVISSAIKNNPELVEAKRRKINYKKGEMLASIVFLKT